MIADTSPLIIFAKAKRLDLLHAVVGPVTVPDVVWQELVADETKDGVPDLQAAEWIARTAPEPTFAPALAGRLHPGEAEAIGLALVTGEALIMDDRRGREIAESLGVQVVGCVGLILQAKRLGLIPSVAKVLAELEQVGLRLSPALRQAALESAAQD